MAIEVLVSIASRAGIECLAAKAKVDRAFRQDTNENTFNNEDMEVGYLNHRRPLYLAASINQIPIKRALVDTGVSVILILINMLQATRILKSKIQ